MTESLVKQPRTILIMAAGTGGHVFPGIAIAKVLAARGWRVVWMGTPTGMENKLVAEAGYPMTTVNMGLLPTKGLTLPLLSFGGTGIVVNCIAVAILLRIDHENRYLMNGGSL